MTENVELRIVSGEILKNLFLKLSFKKKDKDEKDRIFNDTMSGKSDKPIHDDLKKAFRQLIPHYILICQQEDFEKHKVFFQHIIEDIANEVYWPGDEFKKITIDEINPEEDKPNAMLSNYRVPAFTVEGDGENEGVVLIGTRQLNDDLDSIAIVSPTVCWSKSTYPFLHELRLAVEECQEEVLAYYNGKCAPPRQQEIDFPEEGDDMRLEISAGGQVVKTTLSNLKKVAKKGTDKKSNKKIKAEKTEELSEEVGAEA